MPNRIIREGILSSARVSALTAEAERLYTRLMLVVDDYGRIEADARLLVSKCFPLRSRDIRDDQLEKWLSETAAIGLVLLYQAGGKRYLQVQNFGQRVRSASKCPDPLESTPADICEHPPTVAVICEHPHASRVRTNTHTNTATHLEVSDSQKEKFEEFWNVFPRKEAKAAGLRAYLKRVRDGPTHDAVMAALREQKPRLMQRDPENRPHAATWLNQERWKDEPEQPRLLPPPQSDLDAIFERI